ncbi:hypothetical protein ES703_53846 [subsurface metagenome]
MVSGLIPSQQNKVIVVFVTGIAAEAAIGGDIYLAADDGLYTCLPGCQIELNNAIHNTVVGYGQAIHPQSFGSFNQLGNAAHAIK